MAGLSCEGLDNTASEWMEYAACRGVNTDVFFVQPGENPYEAITYCSRCDVQKECLQYAVDNGLSYGIFGGKSQRQRRNVDRRDEPIKVPVRAKVAALRAQGLTPAHIAVELDIHVNQVHQHISRARTRQPTPEERLKKVRDAYLMALDRLQERR